MSYPENTASILAVAYPHAINNQDYRLDVVPGGIEISNWNSELGPQPTEIQVYEWSVDADLLPSGYIFTAAVVALQVFDDTEQLYVAGMPVSHPVDGEVMASLHNAEWVSPRVDQNDTQQGRLAGSASPPYFFIDTKTQVHRMETDADHEVFWLAMNNHTSAIFGSHSLLIERLRQLGTGQTQAALDIGAESTARTPQNIIPQFVRLMSDVDALLYATNQVEQVNNRSRSEYVSMNGHQVRAHEVRELHDWLTSGEDDYPYWLQVLDDDPIRIGNEQQARQVLKRLAEKRRRVRAEGRKMIKRMRRAASRPELIELIQENMGR